MKGKKDQKVVISYKNTMSGLCRHVLSTKLFITCNYYCPFHGITNLHIVDY